MTDYAVRQSPSGPIIANDSGGTLVFGIGARLRLAEVNSPMSGTVSIPTPGASLDASALASNGFGGNAPIIVQFANPQAGRRYRAELRLDVYNPSPTITGGVVLYIQTSVDAGATWQTRAVNGHQMQPQDGVDPGDDGTAREVSITLDLGLGSALGVVASTTALLFRPCVQRTGTPAIEVSSLSSIGGVNTPDGTIHFEAEECF